MSMTAIVVRCHRLRGLGDEGNDFTLPRPRKDLPNKVSVVEPPEYLIS